jgi:hypothetical protein
MDEHTPTQETMTMAAAATTAPKPTAKPKKDPKPLIQRVDEQLTRAAVAKRVTAEELEKLEGRIGRLKVFLQG